MMGQGGDLVVVFCWGIHGVQGDDVQFFFPLLGRWDPNDDMISVIQAGCFFLGVCVISVCLGRMVSFFRVEW